MGFREVDRFDNRMRVGQERRLVPHANEQERKSARGVFVIVYDKNLARSCRHVHDAAIAMPACLPERLISVKIVT